MTASISHPAYATGYADGFLKENKLTCSDKLGDIVRLHDMTLALSVYLRANVPNMVIACSAETGQTEKIVLHSKKVGYSPDDVLLLQHITRTNPEKGAEFAAQLVNDETGPLVDVERVVDVFNMIQPATSYALKEEQARTGPSPDTFARDESRPRSSSRQRYPR
jgi:clathrin heavy chain